MSAVIMEQRLLETLGNDPELAGRGCHAVTGAGNTGVAVGRGSSQGGTWHWRHGVFELTEAGATGTTATAETVAEAAHITRLRLLASP